MQEQEQLQYVYTELSVARVHYYEQQAYKIFEEYGSEFKEFTRDLLYLKRRGDNKIKSVEATGYNILRSTSAMDLKDDKPILFYNNYITDPYHFGLVLAELEHKGLITEDEVSFGVKASSVVTRVIGRSAPEWDTTNERRIKRKHRDGYKDEVAVEDTLEIVLSIKVRGYDPNHAIDLAEFFHTRTNFDNKIVGEASIQGSWFVPDIRATISLSNELLHHGKYIQAMGNFIKRGSGSLIILRDTTGIVGHEYAPLLVNMELKEYLAKYGVEE